MPNIVVVLNKANKFIAFYCIFYIQDFKHQIKPAAKLARNLAVLY